jgi:hypothetical protein
MRVAAGLATFFLVNGVSAVAQYSPLPTTTIPDAVNSVCYSQILPDKDHNGKGSTTTECKTTVAQGCPVDMRVRQRMGGAAVAADENGVKRRMFAQRLRLLLNDLRPDMAGRKVVSATVTVHGTGVKARMQHAGSGNDRDSIVKTLSVDLANWGEPGFSGDLFVPGFTSTSRVDLESVTYDDGSTWKLSKNESCRVAPDPMMLINH